MKIFFTPLLLVSICFSQCVFAGELQGYPSSFICALDLGESQKGCIFYKDTQIPLPLAAKSGSLCDRIVFSISSIQDSPVLRLSYYLKNTPVDHGQTKTRFMAIPPSQQNSPWVFTYDPAHVNNRIRAMTFVIHPGGSAHVSWMYSYQGKSRAIAVPISCN